MGLGKKLSSSIKSIGKKVSNTASGLGKKIVSVEQQAQKGIAKGIDLGQKTLERVDEGIASASGKIGSVKQGLLKGARVIDALQSTGLASTIPGLGIGLGAVSAGLKGGAAGLKQVQNVGSDARLATGKGKNQLSTVGGKASAGVSRVAGRAGAQVERVGERAKALEAQAQEEVRGVRSAFRA